MGMEQWWNGTDRGTPKYTRTPLIPINWDGKSSGYAENPNNWIFL
jgi:hypothetical protein